MASAPDSARVRRVIVLVVALVLTACGQAVVDPGDATTSTINPPVGDPPEVQRFTVEGAEVLTRLGGTELPERATVVEFSATLIDSGRGPELCLGGVADSLPPQCSGPVVDGIEMGGWAESAAGVTWGERTIVVAWPPQDGRLTLIEDRAYEPPAPAEDHDDSLPVECEAIAAFVPVEELAAWAEANPDRAGVVSVVRGGTIGVLRVKGDLESVAEELRTGDAEPCLVSVPFSTTELVRLQDRLNTLFGTDTHLTSTGSGNILNKVTVGVAVADRATVRSILELVDDPAMVQISGFGRILDGR